MISTCARSCGAGLARFRARGPLSRAEVDSLVRATRGPGAELFYGYGVYVIPSPSGGSDFRREMLPANHAAVWAGSNRPGA